MITLIISVVISFLIGFFVGRRSTCQQILRMLEEDHKAWLASRDSKPLFPNAKILVDNRLKNTQK